MTAPFPHSRILFPKVCFHCFYRISYAYIYIYRVHMCFSAMLPPSYPAWITKESILFLGNFREILGDCSDFNTLNFPNITVYPIRLFDKKIQTQPFFHIACLHSWYMFDLSINKSDSYLACYGNRISSPRSLSFTVMMPILDLEFHHSTNGSTVGLYFQVYREGRACRTSIMFYFLRCAQLLSIKL